MFGFLSIVGLKLVNSYIYYIVGTYLATKVLLYIDTTYILFTQLGVLI